MANVRSSAVISATTKEKVERFARARGVSKGHLIEKALLHHLRALAEIPASAIIPPIEERMRVAPISPATRAG